MDFKKFTAMNNTLNHFRWGSCSNIKKENQACFYIEQPSITTYLLCQVIDAAQWRCVPELGEWLPLTKHTLPAEIMAPYFAHAHYSAVHWSILIADTQWSGPCSSVGNTIFVSAISSNHRLLRAEARICHSCCLPSHLSGFLFFSWGLASQWKVPWVLQMNAAVTPNAKMSRGHQSESLSVSCRSSLCSGSSLLLLLGS